MSDEHLYKVQNERRACNNRGNTQRLVKKLRMNQWPLKLLNQIELLDACAENRLRGSLTCGSAIIIRVLCVCVNQHEGMFMYSV